MYVHGPIVTCVESAPMGIASRAANMCLWTPMGIASRATNMCLWIHMDGPARHEIAIQVHPGCMQDGTDKHNGNIIPIYFITHGHACPCVCTGTQFNHGLLCSKIHAPHGYT